MVIGVNESNLQQCLTKAIDEALKDAGTRGWEAVILIIVMVGLIVLTGFIVRWLIRSMDKRMEEAKEREDRMCKRLNDLENFVQTTLLNVINETSTMTANVLDAVRTLSSALTSRPCLLNSNEVKKRTEKVNQ
jgi:glutamine amidotransferase-like uncharacterized protein